MSLNAPPHINNGGSLVWIGRAAKESQDRLERPWCWAGNQSYEVFYQIRRGRSVCIRSAVQPARNQGIVKNVFRNSYLKAEKVHGAALTACIRNLLTSYEKSESGKNQAGPEQSSKTEAATSQPKKAFQCPD